MSSMIQTPTTRTQSIHARDLIRWAVLLVTAALFATGALLALDLINTSTAKPAALGEDVSIPGGVLRVDQVTPEHMAPMQSGNFGASGMSMNSMGMDMAPAGYRRFTVAVTLGAQNWGDLQYVTDQFKLSGEGMEPTTAIRHELGDGVIGSGMNVTGNLVFQAPETVAHLQLQFGDARPIAIDLPAADEHDQDHGTDHNNSVNNPDDGHTDHSH